MSKIDETSSKKRKVEAQSADALEDGLDYEVDSDAAAADLASIDSHSDDANSDSDNDDDEDKKEAEGSVKKVVSREQVRLKRKARQAITKKRKLEESGVDNETNDGEDSILNIDQQADLFARLIRDNAAKDGLTSIELSDMYLPASAFLDTSTFSGTGRTLATVASFITTFTVREDLKSANKEFGRPHTLVLAASAIRVADLTRSLKPHLKSKTAEPAKLFGKEKVATQVATLEKTRINVAIGVPGRVLALITNGALKVDRIEQIYIDHSYRDPKKRSITQIKEVVKDLVEILRGEGIGQKISDGGCKIVLF